MSWPRFRARARSRADLDHAREFDAHLQIEIDDLIARGLPPEAARRAARRKFGSPTAIREQVYETAGIPWLETLVHDFRYAVRVLLANPTFTLVSLLTLALGIGAATAIFTVVNSVILRPLPYPDANRLVTAWETSPNYNLPGKPPGCISFSPGNYLDLRDQNQSFDRVGAFTTSNFNLSGGTAPDRIVAGLVSASLFPTLGVRPALGRLLLPSDDTPAADRVAIISHDLWMERFAGSPAALGSSLRLDDRAHVIVGILPTGFHLFDEQVDVWLPIERKTTPESMHWRQSYYLRVIARLKPGVTLERARQDVDRVVQSIRSQFPGDLGKGGMVVPLIDNTIARARGPLWILFGAAGFVLLIACANVAHLSLGRAIARRRELALRLALGSGRGRLIRQLFTESLVLAVAGGAAGVGIAELGVRALLRLAPHEIPRAAEIHVDGVVLAFAIAAAALSAIVFGLLPAIGASGEDPQQGLGSGRSSGGPGSERARGGLIVSEIAVALVLMIGAALMIESFRRVSTVNPGFDPHGLIAMRVSLSPSRYDDLDKQNAFYHRILERIRAMPGLKAAGAIDGLPFTDGGFDNSFSIDGRPDPPPGQFLQADIRRIDAGYFAAMSIPLLAGRGFTDSDRTSAPAVAIVSQSMARKYWPDGRAVGQRVTLHFGPPEGIHAEIVGVAGDVRGALDARPNDDIYVHYPQGRSVNQMDLVLRSAGAGDAAAAVRSAIAAIDRDQPVYHIRSMESLVAVSLAARRFQMLLLALFAAFAGTLAAVGLYGLLAYTVQARTKEIGIRTALGATHGQVSAMVLRQALRMTATGVLAGVIGSFALTRLLAGLLYGVRPTDPLIFAAVSLLLLAVAAAAGYLPARRAARIDPMITLRHD